MNTQIYIPNTSIKRPGVAMTIWKKKNIASVFEHKDKYYHSIHAKNVIIYQR